MLWLGSPKPTQSIKGLEESMAYVTDVIITCDNCELSNNDQQHPLPVVVWPLSDWLYDQSRSTLRRISKYSGGRHKPNSLVFMTTVNHLDRAAFIELVDNVHWKRKTHVQVWLKSGNANIFDFYRFGNHSPKLIAPTPAAPQEVQA